MAAKGDSPGVGDVLAKAVVPHPPGLRGSHPLGLCGVPTDMWAEMLSHWGPDTPVSQAPGTGSWSAHSKALQEVVTGGPPSCALG